MKSTKLLIITFLFSSFLAGCGMKGPLYSAPSAQPAGAEQDTSRNATTESPENDSESAVQ